MKLKVTHEEGNFFKKADIGENFVTTNVFGGGSRTQPGDWLELDCSEPDRPVIRSNMQWGQGNYSVARCFVVTACKGTMFGKVWDSFGFASGKLKQHPTRFRGDLGQKAPWTDLEIVRNLVDYPCMVADMPATTVRMRVQLPQSHYGNGLVDMYAHFRNGESGINGHIWAPFSKLLNIQLQMAFNTPHPDNPDGHARGWSGVRSILCDAVIDGQQWRVGWKHETLDGNCFPFLSFCGWDGSRYVTVNQVRTDLIWQWVLENWNSKIRPTIDAAGPDCQNAFKRVTLEHLHHSACDGVHAGCEFLGPSTGEIVFDEMRIDVEKQDVDKPAAYQKSERSSNYADARPRARGPRDQRNGVQGNSVQRSPEFTEKQGDSQRAQNDNLLQLAVGETRSIPGSANNVNGGVEKLGNSPSVIKHTSNWDNVNGVAAIMIEGAEPGSTTVTWGGGKTIQVVVA